LQFPPDQQRRDPSCGQAAESCWPHASGCRLRTLLYRTAAARVHRLRCR
jgi:hypothetical protein